MIDFKLPYSRQNALSFLSRFLPEDFEQSSEENIKLNYKPQYLERIHKIGESRSLQALHVFEVTHGSENDPRVGLSRDAFRLLANFGVRKALIFFVSKKSPNYRLSLVTLDLKLEGKRVEQEYSNPRRYSFFLGPDAKTHTPSDFLLKIGRAKDIADLLSRFDVEIVTKEFFLKYKGLYEEVSGHFEKDHGFKNFAANNNIEIDTFSKKLLGQIVFCYFLQRKGWLGATKGEPINKGDKDFMRSLFNRSAAEQKNFYNDYLEYLFYGSLNAKTEGSSGFYRKHFDCQIPFLNGGLFEPFEDYGWERSFIHIPDKIFSNKDNTGILDVFDLYNFTVYEDDPIDREVSVDPEMLGKVFENLLPENLRRGQGAYYTPREIVHYMCQESLINYLVTETKVETAKIRELVVNRQFEGERSTGFIDKALQNIKVCDPACGSGAFLVGMLHEIVSARHILNPKKDEYQLKKEAVQNCIYGVDIDPGAVEIAKLRLWLSLVVDYELKEIEPLPNLDYKIMCGNSLLEEFEGVKFYDGANDDASLFKDERKEKIKELRNKVKEYFNISDEKEKRRKREEVNKLKDWFIKITLEKRRKEITAQRKKIEARANMFEENSRQEYFTTQGEIFLSEAKIIEVLRELHNPQKARPFFIWRLEFMDVFEEKGGFDVVIANPPYIGNKGHKEEFQEIMRGNLGNFYQRRMDIFYFFFHLALDLGKEYAQVAFISTNYYPTATGAIKLRQDLKSRTTIRKLINFNELRIFESALGQHNMITVFCKDREKSIPAATCITKRTGIATADLLQSIIGGRDEETIYSEVSQEELFDGVDCQIRLFGTSSISGGPIQGILEKLKNNAELLGTICNLDQGIVSGADKVSDAIIQEYSDLNLEKNKGIFILSAEDLKDLNLSTSESNKYLKPFYKNSDIYRWVVRPKRKLYVLYIKDEGESINLGNNLKNHFEKYKKILVDKKKNCFKNKWLKNIVEPWLKRGNYFVLFYPREKRVFENIKIVNSRRAKRNIFALETNKMYEQSDIVITSLKDEFVGSHDIKFILALLNSKLYYQWLYHRGKRKGEMLELFQKPLSEIPFKKISFDEQKPFAELTDRIIDIAKDKNYLTSDIKQAKVKEYERQIDQMVYELYGLTEEEIKIVEESAGK